MTVFATLGHTRAVDANQADLLTTVDPAELGRRIAAIRRAKGLTQAELAGSTVSVGYVSRIEAGQRRPTPAVLERFAARLGVAATELLLGISASEYDEIRLGLDYAELALESGQAAEAETRAAEAAARADAAALTDLRDRARFVVARAQESLGRLDDAIMGLEDLVASLDNSTLRLAACVALSRCFRESGDFARAIDTGDQVLRELAGTPLEDADEAIQLTVTVAAAHFERGDVNQAVRMCRRATDRADRLDSPRARAAAYWNMSMTEAQRGSMQTAVELAERALSLLREGESDRNLGRLQAELGMMQLQLDPPPVAQARRNLERAAELYAWSNASPADLARKDIAMARAHLLSGDPEAAYALAEEVRLATEQTLPLVAAEACTLQGMADMASGDREAARSRYQHAVALLTGLGADRSAAQLWFELAQMLESVGELEASRNAYRSAAAATGLRTQTATTTVRVHA